MKYLTTVNGQPFEVEIKNDGHVIVNGEDKTVDFQTISPALFSAIIDNASFEALVEERDETYNVLIHGTLYEVQVADERQQRLMNASAGFEAGKGEISIKSPMPGLIVAVPVSEGQPINQGDAVCVLESMKMENEIKAPRAGTIGRIHIAKGERVEQNKVLLTII